MGSVVQTKLYRQQHGEILRHLDQVQKTIPAGTEHEICLELSRLAGVLKMHLTLEDQNLYPRMLAHENAMIRKTAENYQLTMSQLAPAYMAFHEKWTKHGAIDADRAQFAKAFAEIRDALQQRIQRENEGLYQLIDEHEIGVVA